MPPEAEAPVSGAMSIEAATAQLDAQEDQQEQQQAAPQGAAAAAAAEPGASDETESEGAASAPDDTSGEAETQSQEGDETTEQEPAAEPLAAPAYWSQEAKARFSALDPELQAVVLAQEGPREAAAAKAKDEAAQVRAAADRELAGIAKFAQEVSTFLPQAVQMFRSRWGDNPDWVAYGQQHGAEAMSLAKAQYDAERGELQKVAQASQVAEAKAHEVYVRSEYETLGKLAPDLTDPKEGQARRSEIVKYLSEVGYQPDSIRQISAQDMIMARKAMLWDRAQAKSTPNPAPKPPAARAPLARGAAAAGPADPAAKAATQAKNRFAQTRSVSDAAAYLDALE